MIREITGKYFEYLGQGKYSENLLKENHRAVKNTFVRGLSEHMNISVKRTNDICLAILKNKLPDIKGKEIGKLLKYIGAVMLFFQIFDEVSDYIYTKKITGYNLILLLDSYVKRHRHRTGEGFIKYCEKIFKSEEKWTESQKFDVEKFEWVN